MPQIKIFGHRGYSAKYPENTLLAFAQAFAHGTDGVECDLQKSRDGHYVLMHDDTVDKTALNKTGRVNAMSLAELKTCDLGQRQTIPELTEFLRQIPPGKYLNLELKKETLNPEDCPLIGQILQAGIKKEYLIVSSFIPELLVWFRRKGFTTALIIGFEHKDLGAWKLFKLIWKLNPRWLNIPINAFTELGDSLCLFLVHLVKFFGKKVGFWTIDTAEHFEKIRRITHAVITNQVEEILKSAAKE